ncbi:unnamed protein product, partial [Rotaria sp. Silwood1]
FDVSGTKLRCRGRPCARCHKCRDWHFTGNQDTWDWICTWENFKDKDWKRYRNDRIYNLFEKRDGATCRRRGGRD